MYINDFFFKIIFIIFFLNSNLVVLYCYVIRTNYSIDCPNLVFVRERKKWDSKVGGFII